MKRKLHLKDNFEVKRVKHDIKLPIEIIERIIQIFFEENLKPKTIITYPDNSVVFPYIGGCNSTNSNLRYRVLYPNGTSNLITVYDYDHQIPSFNFCDGIYFFETIPNYILITYNDKKGKDALVYAMMIDWSGKITR